MIRVDFMWDRGLNSSIYRRLRLAQEFVDSECIRLMEQYTPYRSGTLCNAVRSGSVVGSGRLVYPLVYARYQYYGVVYAPNFPIYRGGEVVGFYSPPHKYPTSRQLVYSTSYHPQAQRLWFEIMKTNYKNQILRGARQRF